MSETQQKQPESCSSDLADNARVQVTNYCWFPVRCCCQPLTLLGFLRLPENTRAREILDVRGESHRIEVRGMGQTLLEENAARASIEMAIYSDDRSIEFWRSIPGFVEIAARGR